MKKKLLLLIGLIGITLYLPVLPNQSGQDNSQNTIVYVATRNEKNALKSAKKYAKYMHLSKQAVYDQLTFDFDKFSPEDAQCAIDHLKVNFNKISLKAGKTYSKTLHFSKQ